VEGQVHLRPLIKVQGEVAIEKEDARLAVDRGGGGLEACSTHAQKIDL